MTEESTTKPKNPRLLRYWDAPVEELVRLNERPLADGERERHRLYSLALMSIVYHYWCGNKDGLQGKYPLNPPHDAPDGPWLSREYRGHNIAAFAVDADGDIIDFEFNHNDLFNSSAEHAEARLIRRVFALSQVNDGWNVDGSPVQAKNDGSTFSEVVVYTSLESCSQCAGVMALAQVRGVVYLQTDPTMYMIGNILRNLTKKKDDVEADRLQAPRPIAGSEIGLGYFAELDAAYDAFRGPEDEGQLFYEPPKGEGKWTTSITSFLCTAEARRIYGSARQEFLAYVGGEKSLDFPGYRPSGRKNETLPNAMTNQAVLGHLHRFFLYATQVGRRGTPHR